MQNLDINKAGQKIKVSPSAIWDHINQSGHAASLEDPLVFLQAVQAGIIGIIFRDFDKIWVLFWRPMVTNDYGYQSFGQNGTFP